MKKRHNTTNKITESKNVQKVCSIAAPLLVGSKGEKITVNQTWTMIVKGFVEGTAEGTKIPAQ